MPERRVTPLLDLDPDLGQLIEPGRRAAADTELQVRVHRLGGGLWDVSRLEDASPEHLGLLLLDGILAREVLVADTVSTELLGPGDVLRPWALPGSSPLLQLSVRWNALTESRLAILDRSFAIRLAHWPEVNSVLIDRLNDRAQRLATTQAISQLNRVDRRILALFWHLAERWGRVTGEGLAVPLTLSHRMLGQLVGARRPTVSTAIGELAKRGELVRRSDGSWLLTGQPIGLPTPETRVVPIRRKLLPPEVGPVADGVEPLGKGAELRATVARLRRDSEERAAALGSLRLRMDELVRANAELLARPQRQHAARRAGNGHAAQTG